MVRKTSNESNMLKFVRQEGHGRKNLPRVPPHGLPAFKVGNPGGVFEYEHGLRESGFDLGLVVEAADHLYRLSTEQVPS